MPADEADTVGAELNAIAADLLCGPNPSIPYEDSTDADRTAFAFECAKEMLIECIKEREFDDMNSGRIARIVRRRDHKHIKGRG